MQLDANQKALDPPSRRLKPSVKVSDDTFPDSSSRRTINAYFSDLTAEQGASISNVLAQLPTIIKDLKKEHLERTQREMRAAFTIPISVVLELNQLAWTHERWHEAVLKELPCLTLEEAIARCDAGPWDLYSDLLVLPHKGRSHIPSFQFDSSGAPSAVWITLIAELKGAKSHPEHWDILAWLLRPHPILKDCSPMSMYMKDPQRVRQLARSAKMQGLV